MDRIELSRRMTVVTGIRGTYRNELVEPVEDALKTFYVPGPGIRSFLSEIE